MSKIITQRINDHLQKDRETLGKLCLRSLIETLINSSLPTDIRKTVRKLIASASLKNIQMIIYFEFYRVQM